MRFKLFCIHVLLFIFCAITFDLGAGGGSAPELVFKSWKPGQSPLVNGPYIAGKTTEEELSFLTNEETKCKLQVKVGYANDNPANAYRLNSYEFKIDAKVLLPGLSEEEQKKHTFTFPQKGKQNVDAGATSFSYSDEGTLTQHWSPSGVRRKHCSNYAHRPEYNPQEAQQKGRKLAINVTFIGYYGTDPNNEQKREIKLPLDQYEIDQMRQEYLDQRSTQKSNKPGDSPISVPSRTDFSSGDEYSDAHAHNKMINRNLKDKQKHWTEACDKYVGEILEKDHRIESLHVTGGYRNAHHHLYHVVLSINADTAFRSYHQYGKALDVRTVDMDGDGEIENSRATNWQDGKYMADAARDYASAGYRKWTYDDGHVHAQWDGNSTSSERVSQAPEEQQNNPSPPTPTPHTTPSMITYACGVHSGDPNNASSDHSTLINGYSGSFYECQSHQTYGCGHKDLNNNSSSHALQASCLETDSYGQGCTVTNFYACQTHTHQYPALISGACGHTYTSANASLHALQASCLLTNANGDSCTVTDFYACQSHTCQYPAPTISCGRSACQETVSSTDEHRETCASGHLYWSCKPSDVHLHKTRTCIRSGCGQSWLLCTSSKPNCLVNAAWKCRAQ